MKKPLIIVESPHKAKTIQQFLNNEVTVLASKGHICDLPTKALGIDVNNGYKPEYIVTESQKATVKQLQDAVSKASKVYLATDPDREGEAIAWHLKNTLGITEEISRIEYNEITVKAVKAAMANPRALDLNLINSQQARRVLDRIIGYKISPMLKRRIKTETNLSAGRVQSAALEMIVSREREIKNFKPEEYWTINANLLKDGAKKIKANLFVAQLNDRNGEKVRVTNGNDAQYIVEEMRKANYHVDNVTKSVTSKKPFPPFTTSTMLQDSAKKLNFTSDKTSRLAQSLYEGVQIQGEGQHALITYIRTDSVRVSPDFANLTLSYIKDTFGYEYAPKKQNEYKTSSNAQDAHEAIRPVDLKRTPQSLDGKIDKDLFKLYKLIYERYLASQMTPAFYNTMEVHILGESANEKLGFVVKGKSIKSKGYTVIYTQSEDNINEDDKEMDTMPDLNKDEILNLDDVKCEQKFTKPAQRYNDASLTKALEDNGIGRPSTYPQTISVLTKREYVVREKKAFVPTELGEKVCEYMENNFKHIMDLTFTARSETKLDEIAEGKLEWVSFINSYYPFLMKIIEEVAKRGGEKITFDKESDVICSKCGAKMVIKDGKFGQFLACPNYPKCKNIIPIEEDLGTCPQCGGKIKKIQTKSGKPFYGCANYPTCDFKSWDLPAPIFCPECACPMKIVKKNDKVEYVCTKNYKHRVAPISKIVNRENLLDEASNDDATNEKN